MSKGLIVPRQLFFYSVHLQSSPTPSSSMIIPVGVISERQRWTLIIFIQLLIANILIFRIIPLIANPLISQFASLLIR
jgi:hypothetical protein